MTSPDYTRREFSRCLAAGATAPLFAGEIAAADQHTDQPVVAPRPPQCPDPAVAEKPKDAAELLAEAMRQRYPHERLEAAILDHIRRDVESDLARSRILSSFPLTNADEPAFVFAAWRNDH